VLSLTIEISQEEPHCRGNLVHEAREHKKGTNLKGLCSVVSRGAMFACDPNRKDADGKAAWFICIYWDIVRFGAATCSAEIWQISA